VEENGEADSAPVIRARWEEEDTARWVPFGSHPAEVVTLDGEEVLEIRGDEKYGDGILSNFPINLTQGTTVEFEFRMEMNRNVHQRFSLSVWDFDPTDFDRGEGRVLGGGASARVAYPSRDLEKHDPSDIRLMVSPGVETRVNLPEALPSSGWTHLAIQVRADGEVSLVVNRERVGTSPVLLNTVPIHRWNLVLEGDAVGTRLFFRNLNIWPEVRY
jgi:hypothetical protein